MSLLISDGLDTTASYNDLSKNWDTIPANNAYGPVSATAGRTGGSAFTNTASASNTAVLAKFLPFPLAGVGQDALIYSCSIQYLNNPTAVRPVMHMINTLPAASISSAPWAATETWISVGLNTTGQLVLQRNGVVLATGTTPMVIGEWKRVEVRLSNIDDVGANAVVRMNGVTEIDFTGDLYVAGSRQIDAVGYHFNNHWRADDFLVLSSAGSSMNGFLGDLIIDTLKPTGPGTTTQSTPNTGTAWQAVLTNDGNTTYTAIDSVGNKDTYAYGNMAVTPLDILGVVVTTVAQSPGMTPRQFKPLARLAGVETEGAGQNVLLDMSTGYRTHRDIFLTKPGGGAWTRADVDAAEFGWKVTQ